MGQSGPFSQQDSEKIAKLIFQSTNKIRSQRGVSTLFWDHVLAEVAFRHSRDMCLNNFFDHINLRGEDCMDRVLNFTKKKYFLVGENIFKVDTNYDLIRSFGDLRKVVDNLMKGWMDSPGHRKNILCSDFRFLGVGVYATEDDVFATQLFGA